MDRLQDGARGARRRVAAGLTGAVVAAALLGGCGGAGGAGGGGAGGGAAAGAGETITLKATDFKYDPGTVKVASVGDVTIKLDNKGQLEHDLIIDGVPGKLNVKAGATGTATFKVPKAGSYTFACSVAGHRDAGMKGTLTVG